MKLQRYRELDSQRLALTQPPSTQDVIAKLTMAKRDAYRESEEYAEQWIEESGGGEDVSEFIKQFIANLISKFCLFSIQLHFYCPN